MYPYHVFNLEPAGTFGMYPICYWWVSGGYIQPEPAMYSRCFCWFPGPLAPSVGVGNELGRRRGSVGSRHFKWRTGWWCRMQRLTLLLAAHVRHGLIWSSLPLPRDLFVHWLDKPWIFFSHSDPKLFGVWCYFYLHLTHLCSILVTPLSSDPPLSPIAPLWFPGTHPILR